MPTPDNDQMLSFLLRVARILLEFSARAEGIRKQVDQLAGHFGIGVTTVVSYRSVTLLVADGRHLHAEIPEHRLNVSAVLALEEVIDAVRQGDLTLAEATAKLDTVVRPPAAMPEPVLIAIFGFAAAALAWILHGDWGAIAVSGVASALGLIARRALGKRHVILFLLPFTGALIGALIGGIAIRLGWTSTPALCLIVPSLMLVPGPHLLNCVEDIIENHTLTGLGRLGLAGGILIAAGFGLVAGTWLTLEELPKAENAGAGAPLNLALDMVLAGVAALGFGAVYNAPWRASAVSVLCGMAGHGLRYACLAQGLGLGVATLLACLLIGIIAGKASEHFRMPFAALAFAAAVTMMPGLFIYQSFAGATLLAGAGRAADPALAAATLGLFFKAAFIVMAMAVGLLAGARISSLKAARHPRL